MIHLSYEPKKAVNTDDRAICYTTDKNLWDKLKIGDRVTLQGTVKYIPKRRDPTSPAQVHIYECVEVNAEGADAERAKRYEEEAKRRVEEARAQSALRAALQVASQGFKKEARKRYQEIIDKYPDTEAAAKAKKLLEKP